MLRLTEITKDYKTADETVHALRGVTVAFRKKEFVSILGPSGCGKTTLMNVIGGLDGYTSGELFIDGRSTQRFSAKEWDNYRNKRIGFVFQNYNLIPHLSVLKNVEMALTLSGVSPEKRKKAAKEALAKVGLQGQEKKRPNQLSGGQMQRVAIARAIVNAPDVLLADEPTGALDTETGKQIMDVLKELSEDRLVIIVTHNPDLAEQYSTRIIRIIDGLITSDTDPYEESGSGAADVAVSATEGTSLEQKAPKGRKDRTAMSFLTALVLSLGNLGTKRGRTALTSIAGSIGIIGISLILALSNGLNLYIDKLTTDTLSTNPITISETAIDVDGAMDFYYGDDKGTKYPAFKEIVVRKITEQVNTILASNVITQEYVDFVEQNLTDELVYDVLYETGLEFFIYTESEAEEEGVVRLQSTSNWNMLVTNDFINTQYDLLGDSRLPTTANELLLIVDEYNRLSDSVLAALGLTDVENIPDRIPFSQVLGKKYYFLSPDDAFTFDGKKYVVNEGEQVDLSKGFETTIVGIARLNKNTESGALNGGIGYTKELYQTMIERYQGNSIVEYIEENENKDPLTGMSYSYSQGSMMDMLLGTGSEQLRDRDLRKFGGITVANDIFIYPRDFDCKTKIKAILDKYNESHKEEKITYTDMTELVSRVVTSIVNVVSYVLIGFTAVSLIVSGVMIGIITYISVIERTKEIGILRALGARKKDVTRVFNAETFIIGLFAGVFGVAVTGLLTIPINAIIGALAGVYGIANLNVWHGFLMIGVSVLLTVLSGLIPAVKASRKDPVTALRTE